jgi:MoaA/NifB/PqqE/SkfB family radical SAM enzyme
MNEAQPLLKNQDLFRASPSDLNPEEITTALQWLRGSTLYPSPRSIHFDLTLRCTAHCLHCKQWTWPLHTELNLPKLTELIRIFQSWGVRTLTVGGGNPLLHLHFIDVLRMARQVAMHVGIITEGCQILPATAEAIAKHASWIRFSLDGPTAQVHDRIRNSPGLFENVLSSISDLQSHRTSIQIGLIALCKNTMSIAGPRWSN